VRTYIVTDIEADSPLPGLYQMISFAAAAVNEKGEVLSTFLGACCPFSLSEGKDSQRYDLLSLCTV